MSFTITTNLHCDYCSGMFTGGGVTSVSPSRSEMWKIGRNAGWRMVNGRHACPLCKEKIIGRKDPDPNHLCHWNGCKVSVHPSLWGCARHWYALPSVLRGRIWATYREVQEFQKNPSEEYIKAAKDVDAWIRENDLEEKGGP